ncbi:pirin family protein [Sphingomonas sp. ASV193]|uniref:pirin family protein n=1 Tax=Sphingomonas sp. ASV193 TaxID=3144405 RepID=UPI0032E8B33E
MTDNPAFELATADGSTRALRGIEHRVREDRHGPIARLISPDGLGERLKPFIFLDHFKGSIEPGFGFGIHPHSGIATLTWQPGTDVRYRDTTGKNGVLKAGGLEWMNAGGGAWHEATLLGSGHVTGFQLWVPMPPGVEDGPSLGQYVPPDDVPQVAFPGGTVAVLLGSMDTPAGVIASPITSHQDMNYFVVSLEAGATWRYEPPVTHDVAWAFAFEGMPLIQGEDVGLEFVVMADRGAIDLSAQTEAARVLVGTAKRYDHDLIVGTSSVHSNPTSLARALSRIAALKP